MSPIGGVYWWDETGMGELFRQFSHPVESRATSPPRRRARSEGGKLGYALVHAFGAVFDNPELEWPASSGTAGQDGAARDRRAVE